MEHRFPVTLLAQQLEGGLYLGEILFFPGISRIGHRLHSLKRALLASARETVKAESLLELHRRHPRGMVQKHRVRIEIPPPRAHPPAWSAPLSLSFDFVSWDVGDGTQRAMVPALNIEMLASARQDLAQQVRQEIQAALTRTGATSSLASLALTQRCQRLRVSTLILSVDIRAALQRAQGAAPRESVLRQVAANLHRMPLRPAYSIEALLSRLVEALAGPDAGSVLLVGPPGVGKTAAMHELVRSRDRLGLERFHFWATSGARLVSGAPGFGAWQERCLAMVREASMTRAVLHLGHLVELLDAGKHSGNAMGVGEFLRPLLERGELLAVAECTPEQLPILEARDARLVQAFRQIRCEEPTTDQGLAILLDFATAAATGESTPIDLAGIEQLDRLHRRYATYSAYPGRPLRFLEGLLSDRSAEQVLSAQDVSAAFARETGMPLFMLDDDVPMDAASTRSWFSERVRGQDEAVDAVTELLLTVKAGLSRPRKPLAVMLFIGPTGVGKTEMAKALAEYLFGDPARVTRFDMTEYSDPIAVQRLIRGSDGRGLLTSKLREQPFTVLLLDEIEKADPAFFDLLLQVLGEGRLTDATGDVADFCNAIVVMTSNLGARAYTTRQLGFGANTAERREARASFLREVRAFFRPELVNRIDRLIPFAPLDESTIVEIAMRALERINSYEGMRSGGHRLHFSGDVARELARRAYDARYGARPLRRRIEREVLAPLASQLTSRHRCRTWGIHVEQEGVQVRLEPVQETERPAADHPRLNPSPSGLRRRLRRLVSSHRLAQLANERRRAERIEEKLGRARRRRRPPSEIELRMLDRLPKLRSVLDGLKQIEAEVLAADDAHTYRAVTGDDVAAGPSAKRLDELESSFFRLGLDAYGLLRFPNADRVTVAVFSEALVYIPFLARVYFEVARDEGADVTGGFWLLDSARRGGRSRMEPKRRKQSSDVRGVIRFQPRDDLKAVFADPFPASAIGIGLRIAGPNMGLWFHGEAGLHKFVSDEPSRGGTCLAEVSELNLPLEGEPREVMQRPKDGRDSESPERDERYAGFPDMGRRGAIDRHSKVRRRTYDLVHFRVVDHVLGVDFTGSREFTTPIRTILRKRLASYVEEMGDA